MDYSVAHFTYSFAEDWQRELFEQALADMGFDSFCGSDAYVQTALLDASALDELVGATDGVSLVSIERCPDANWNVVWEAEHLPHDLPLGIQIVPDCAFGSGTHPTTRMLLSSMLSLGSAFMSGRHVLDNGCGTGILAVLAARLGAASVRAVDMDPHSVASTRANAARNGVAVDVVQGTEPVEGHYDLILSNIHRNVLLGQMPLYARFLTQGGELWLSGFYESDCQPLVEAAALENMKLLEQHCSDGWCMLRLLRE